MRLFVFTMPGCEACEAAESEIDEFATKHPMAMILRVRADGPIAQSMRLKVTATPTYLLLDDANQGVQHVGMMTAKEMEKWITKATR